MYDDVMFQIEEIRTEAAVNAIAFMLLLLIIAFVVKIDVESYLYHHGRRLDVSYLLGYGFMNVHGKRLLKSERLRRYKIAYLFQNFALVEKMTVK